MIRVRPMTMDDAEALRPIRQQQMPAWTDEEFVTQLSLLSEEDDVWAFYWDDTLLAIGGCHFPWINRMVVWITLDEGVSKYLLPLTRFLRVFIDEYHMPRVEMHVCAAFPPGARWARLLGFTPETPEPLQRFFPTGDAGLIFARCV